MWSKPPLPKTRQALEVVSSNPPFMTTSVVAEGRATRLEEEDEMDEETAVKDDGTIVALLGSEVPLSDVVRLVLN